MMRKISFNLWIGVLILLPICPIEDGKQEIKKETKYNLYFFNMG